MERLFTKNTTKGQIFSWGNQLIKNLGKFPRKKLVEDSLDLLLIPRKEGINPIPWLAWGNWLGNLNKGLPTNLGGKVPSWGVGLDWRIYWRSPIPLIRKFTQGWIGLKRGVQTSKGLELVSYLGTFWAFLLRKRGLLNWFPNLKGFLKEFLGVGILGGYNWLTGGRGISRRRTWQRSLLNPKSRGF